uniref:Ulp1 protease-like n=1 Tax=Oryza sativa subsp. japonica TaxID=39947 RepID=Q2QNQ8_ORYSJ|nr:hypothetical protein LOC_Os12g37040 [Oryza sativa Japonica Group]
MPRADKALSDPVETKDHENSIRHYGRLHVSMVLHQDRLRRVRPMLTRLRRRLYAFSIARERLLDLDKEYRMKKWRRGDTINTVTTIKTHHNQQPPQYTEQQKPIQAYIRQDKTPDIDFRDRHGYSPMVSPDTVRRDESAISDLAGHGFEEEGYPVVDYESAFLTVMSTTVR